MQTLATQILKDHWGYDAFRPGQLEIVTAIFAKRDTLALLPTGGGKSICFQVPAVGMGGLTLVISPLIALMKDQVETLVKKGISAVALHSGMSAQEIQLALDQALRGEINLLYISPERLTTQNFRGYLTNLNIKLLVVDEAHCISMWGQDFRPSYQKLADIRAYIPGVPIAAFTASAPSWIQEDIVQGLRLQNPYIHRGDFSRNNLIFHALKSEDKSNHIVRILQKTTGSALVFGHTRKSVESLCKTLREQGISASFYHAGLTAPERSARQTQWVENGVRVMVCTNAFGMGVDKPDVRVVIHAFPPKNPEDYYQEAGRAGRDGQLSHCVLLHHPKDWEEIQESLYLQHPVEDVLKQAYHGILNFLGISDGEGEGRSLPVNLIDIAQQLNVQPKSLYYAVKALEMLGQWQWTEGQYQPSKILMTGTESEIFDFKEAHPAYSGLLDMLLRGHGGIFDHSVVIQEATIARRLRKGRFEEPVTDTELQQVQKMLKQLEKSQILRYKPTTELPLLSLNESRSLYPSLNMSLLHNLLRRRLEALDALGNYAQGELCRSVFWQTYFTENGEVAPCGKCDVCRRSHRIAGDLRSRAFWQNKLIVLGEHRAEHILMEIPKSQQTILVDTLRILLDEGCIIENEKQELQWVGESFLL